VGTKGKEKTKKWLQFFRGQLFPPFQDISFDLFSLCPCHLAVRGNLNGLILTSHCWSAVSWEDSKTPDSIRISQESGENRDSEASQNRQENALFERGSVWTAVEMTCRCMFVLWTRSVNVSMARTWKNRFKILQSFGDIRRMNFYP
jgi:hypothetical protein